MKQNFKWNKKRKEESRKKKQQEKRNKRLNKKGVEDLPDQTDSGIPAETV